MWALIGGVLAALDISSAFVWMAFVYAIVYALAEALSLQLRAPTSTWQVPSPWVTVGSAYRRVWVWGMFLGPGIATRNAYACMWLVPLLLATTPSVALGAAVGAMCGAAHGLGRLVGILDVRQTGLQRTTEVLVLRALRWRAVDAIFLALVSGALAAILM